MWLLSKSWNLQKQKHMRILDTAKSKTQTNKSTDILWVEYIRKPKSKKKRLLQGIVWNSTGKITEIVAIDGRLKRVPKKNARGEPILKPENVQVGLNFNVISKEITDTETIIHELRIRENNILKILKKQYWTIAWK